ncbi:unnamed protein product, partial [Prorocentrum cordatum]
RGAGVPRGAADRDARQFRPGACEGQGEGAHRRRGPRRRNGAEWEGQHPMFMDLEHDLRLKVEIVGRSHAAYDCYPEGWPQGRRGPNLQSFAASELLATGAASRSGCLVVGSRGGQ